MAGIKISIDGIPELERELQRLNGIRFDAVTKKQTTQMLNRARQSGGTPVDTGELRASSSATDDEIGYTKGYSPHVEYGHRTVNGGFVPGQYFLKKNVDTQRPIYKQDLTNAVNKEK